MKKAWWKEAVAYQIYPRSFMDSNGDGIGDLQGIIQKLDYLKDLGIDVIWICPIYKSPNADNGYDISDYQDIMEQFGTMKDFDQLLEEIHKRDMKVILDLVINHTSDEHPWFIESRSSRDNPKRDWYIWRDGKNGKEPNNWESIFGGSAWEYDETTDQYYLHVFATKQPDLNWENEDVRRALYDMINWWLDKGIDGFRVDAISHIKKKEGLPDLPNPKGLDYVPSFDGHMNQEGIMEYLRELKAQTFARYDIMTVGEANGVTVEEAEDWVGEENGIFNMIFQFEHLGLWQKGTDGGVDVRKLKRVLTKWQKGLEGVGWNALFLENHDQPRSVSTWGNDEQYLAESAKALGALYFLMQGTPFIYQGQEIGMTNVQFETIDEYDDVAIKNYYRIERAKGRSHEEVMRWIWKNGRDNSRTPMQWSDEKNAGFTTGTPWIGVNENYKQINVQKQLNDPNSVLNFYKRMIQLRKQHDVFVYGTYDLILENHKAIYAYTRTLGDEKAVVIVNLTDRKTMYRYDSLKLNSEQLVLTNYDVKQHKHATRFTLRPYEARVYLMK
ncbi:alpha-glucosidase [Anoxybacillus ayderensis]|uniref:Oligo-1,6-glucosidase n=1 Tax=Anoxybacillus ayderensis TaxID=265546 RepID=A0A0D0HRH5_9BACL|nr:alpha-glucosidase [Anoxybacillus ayderensis]EPZ37851.1 glycosidase [Anoxybacillus ayderensis]KHF28601.1 Oligo-1,6-glucosidase [Anoxybacillus sp. BCO1]KIP21877.1 Oligo-1,6-glucosidase [Anoxybacillus ayderensis]NNU97526.1 alpha-glucosidase [Anoxybacillus sp. EFIL]